MNESQFQVMSDASYARLAVRLLRFLSRSQRRAELPTKSDTARLEWLIKQLIASRRGAETVSVRNAISADDHNEISTSFSSEQALYREFRRYSGAMTPEQHAGWVDEMVRALGDLGTKHWADMDPSRQTIVTDRVTPLLRRMAEANERVEDFRENQLLRA